MSLYPLPRARVQPHEVFSPFHTLELWALQSSFLSHRHRPTTLQRNSWITSLSQKAKHETSPTAKACVVQSSFLVELSETAAALNRATGRSIVALDELGRGTSTSDGAAIASAVLEYLSHETKCRRAASAPPPPPPRRLPTCQSRLCILTDTSRRYLSRETKAAGLQPTPYLKFLGSPPSALVCILQCGGGGI